MKNKAKIRKSYFFIYLFILVVFLFSSCTKKIIETSIGSDKTMNKILIAADVSEFKNKILKRILETFQAKYNIDIVNIYKLNKMSIDEYSAVLIMDTCMAWTGFNLSLKSFIEKKENRDKAVLFITAGDPDWKYSYLELDAVTSASEIENEEIVYSELIARVKTILSNK